jgi:hypothetical protein
MLTDELSPNGRDIGVACEHGYGVGITSSQLLWSGCYGERFLSCFARRVASGTTMWPRMYIYTVCECIGPKISGHTFPRAVLISFRASILTRILILPVL